VRNMPPHGDGVWRLFDLSVDPGETRDLSGARPQLFREMLHEYRLYANRVGVLELPEGYQVEDQIAANIFGKVISFYWGWMLLGFALLLVGVWALWRAVRWGYRRVAG